jgi:hypothetical protein
MLNSITISTQAPESPDMNYALLREEAIQHIQRLSGKVWTDHNIHDPGITTLELLSYAITDLGYRTDYAVKDILASQNTDAAANQPYTAAQILTSNPLTISDYRKLLMDVRGVKNAWLEPVKSKINNHNIKGIYDVTVELEDDERWGDLNKRSIKIHIEQGPYAQENMFVEASVVSELDWDKIDTISQVAMLRRDKDFFKYGDFLFAHQANLQLQVKLKDGTTATRPLQVRVDLLGDENPQEFVIPNLGIGNFIIAAPDETRARQGSDWFFFVYNEDEPIPMEEDDIILNNDTYAATIIELLTGKQFLSILNIEYLPKQSYVADIMREAQERLAVARNLCEDFNALKVVFIQEIALNAHIEIKPNADPEAVFAEIYYRISQYLSPELRRYTIESLLEKGKTTADIFEGILPRNGFIDDDELQRIEKKSVIYASSLINIIMDLPEVISVRSIDMTHYINGLLNLENQTDFIPLVNPNLYMPRISPDKSGIVFYKNNAVEKYNAKSATKYFDNLKQQRRQAPLICPNDIPLEKGRPREINRYYSIQNDFPPVYGIGEMGLADTESPQRRAKAMQLKGYLLFCEQLLANYLSQLTNIGELFSHNSEFVPQTYFYQSLQSVNQIEQLIQPEYWDAKDKNYDRLLGNLVESPETFLQRKNRFLDHLMARFGERFGEYAQLMYALYSEEATDMRHIADRINAEQFEESLKDSIALAQYSLDEMIRRSVKLEVKQAVIALLQKYGTDVKVADAAKAAIKEVLRNEIQKTLDAAFREAVTAGIKAGIDDIIGEIVAELVKKAGEDPRKLEQIIEERKAIKQRLEALAQGEADKIFIGVSRSLFESTIKGAVFNGIDQIMDEVIGELLSGYAKASSKAQEKTRSIEDIVRTIIVRSVGIKVKKTVLDAVKSVVWTARDRVNREINAKTQADLISHKIALLNDYSHISAQRGQGTPYQLNAEGQRRWLCESGFKQRIARLLGVESAVTEPFYVLEHLLLRPDKIETVPQDLLIAQIIQLLDLNHAGNYDYYSFQMSIIAPIYGGRFAHERFRQLFTKTVHLEAPAHLLIYTHWLDEEQMRHFEHLYTSLQSNN